MRQGAVLIAWSAALAAIWLADAWSAFGVPHMLPLFADWHAVLAAVDCSRDGFDVFRQNPCDHWGRLHVYGSLWLQLSHTALSRADIVWTACMLDAAFMLACTALIRPRTLPSAALCLLFFASPATLLALERANNDLVIFLLLTAAGLCLAPSRPRREVFAAFAIALSTALKLYPAAAFATLVVFQKSRTRALGALAVSALLLGAWLAVSQDEIRVLSATVPRPDGPYATGAFLLWRHAGMPLRYSAFALLLLALVAAMALALVRTNSLAVGPRPGAAAAAERMFVLGSTVLVATFFVNPNFDYRWVFFLMTLPWSLEALADAHTPSRARIAIRACLALALIVMWAEAACNAALLLLDAHAATAWIAAIRLCKQVAAYSCVALLSAFSAQISCRSGSFVLSAARLCPPEAAGMLAAKREAR